MSSIAFNDVKSIVREALMKRLKPEYRSMKQAGVLSNGRYEEQTDRRLSPLIVQESVLDASETIVFSNPPVTKSELEQKAESVINKKIESDSDLARLCS